ncbi:hypothetical protein GTY65_30370 [Streptomyces sp. SID8379]|uniref:hypothetical protein n=1 Tax=unclassified Streptomyces TaxID=2593676 RepID=UPI00035CDFBA|nr:MULTISPECIES: hypothetical protein [unclassified Streptomyces]MYW68347.1 hypothetical protein [Streptomyces sp. SID8379]
MTQPPQPQPQDGNPYAQKGPDVGQQPPQAPQQPGYGYPQQQPGQQPPQQYTPFPQQQAGPGGFAPMQQAPGRSGNAALAIVAAVVLSLILAWAYGAIMKATEHEIGYAAIAVGAIVGFAAGKIAGRNPAVPFVAALLSLVAVYLGQMTGLAMALGDYANISFFEALTDHFSLLNDAWKDAADFKSYAFIVVGGIAAFGAAKRAGA